MSILPKNLVHGYCHMCHSMAEARNFDWYHTQNTKYSKHNKLYNEIYYKLKKNKNGKL